MAQPILYGHPLSPYVRKARLTLLFHDVEFDSAPNLPHADDPAFREASPLGRIPAFRDEHLAFSDSSVIAQYVCKFYGDNRLLPQSRAGFVQTLWYEEYCDTVMVPAIAAHLFAEVILAGRLFPRAPIQADIDKARNVELPAIYSFLQSRTADREWLVGETMSLADIAIGGMLLALHHCGDVIPDSAPALQAYCERFFALPVTRQVMADEVQILRGIQYDSPLASRL